MTWDDVWSKPLVTSDYSLKYLNFMAKIETTLPYGSHVLEAGCGTGQTLQVFHQRHHSYGLDISSKAIELAAKNCHYPLLGDILNMGCFPDGMFDLVYNSGVIEHFTHTDALRAIKEMTRVTREGGTVIIIVPNWNCPWFRVWLWYTKDLSEFGHHEPYTISSLIKDAFEGGHLFTKGIFGLQFLPPLATNSWQLLPESWRKILGKIEYLIPLKWEYAYAVGIIGIKPRGLRCTQ
jgi:SAM-dependent methyltransferase